MFLLSLIVILLASSLLLIFYINKEEIEKKKEEKNMTQEVLLYIGNEKFNVEMSSNKGAKAFIDKLKEEDIVIKAHDYGNFEKVGELNFDLPTDDKNITTKSGDIMLYNGNSISLFYKPNTWSYTEIGHLKDIEDEELINILGQGDIELRFTLGN